MIDRLRVRNFRCLRDVEVPLGPLTFLIGPNNTGKSSFLDAVGLLSSTTTDGHIAQALQRAGLRFDRVVTGRDAALAVELDAKMSWHDEGEPYREALYAFAIIQGPDHPMLDREHLGIVRRDATEEFAYDRHLRRGMRFENKQVEGSAPVLLIDEHASVVWNMVHALDERGLRVAQALRCTPKYNLIPQRMAQPCQVQPSTELAGDGYGLASCLDTLREVTPDRFREVECALKQFVSTVDAVTFPTVEPGMKSVLFHEKPRGYKVYASEASDGLLLFLAYLTIAYSHGDASVLLVEEPEQGVHSHRLKAIVELLRAISRGSLGTRPVQVIATSHSPYLLDCCGKEEIAIFARDEEGGVTVTPLSELADIEERLKDFAPGEFIHTFGGRICGSHS